MPTIITLTTDFGTDDPFVSIMKGVILSIQPRATIIDLSHGIEPQNVLQAAWVLKAAVPYFPKKTVHVAVVDPGVGGTRRPIAIQTGSHTFIGPDNGIFTAVMDARSRCFELTKKKYFLKTISGTFHGRDVFAPVAGWIAKGTPLKTMGRPIKDSKIIDLPEPAWKGNSIEGEIVYIDRFGNAATNISMDMILRLGSQFPAMTVTLGKTVLRDLATHYAAVSPGKTGVVINSWNVLEIFKREGHAARSLKLKPGHKIQVTPDP